jgi:hypothetical protein
LLPRLVLRPVVVEVSSQTEAGLKLTNQKESDDRVNNCMASALHHQPMPWTSKYVVVGAMPSRMGLLRHEAGLTDSQEVRSMERFMAWDHAKTRSIQDLE